MSTYAEIRHLEIQFQNCRNDRERDRLWNELEDLRAALRAEARQEADDDRCRVMPAGVSDD